MKVLIAEGLHRRAGSREAIASGVGLFTIRPAHGVQTSARLNIIACTNPASFSCLQFVGDPLLRSCCSPSPSPTRPDAAESAGFRRTLVRSSSRQASADKILYLYIQYKYII